MTKVTYTYTDNALVPIPMATRSALSLALLGKNYASQSDRDPPRVHRQRQGRAGSSSARSGTCSTRRVATLQARDDRRAAEDRRRPPRPHRRTRSRSARSNRLYLPMTAKLEADKTQTRATKYPEYDRLYSGGVEPGKLVIGMVSGMMADWAAGEHHDTFEDGATRCGTAACARSSRRAPASSSSRSSRQADALDFTVGAQERDSSRPSTTSSRSSSTTRTRPGITYSNRNALRKVDRRHARPPLGHLRGARAGHDGRRRPSPSPSSSSRTSAPRPTRRRTSARIKTSDVFVYNGHSYIGYGPLDPSRFTAADFPASYQILFVNGCVSYNYYEKDYIPLKQGGTKNLDLVTNGLESWVNESGHAMGRFVGAFIDGKQSSLQGHPQGRAVHVLRLRLGHGRPPRRRRRARQQVHAVAHAHHGALSLDRTFLAVDFDGRFLDEVAALASRLRGDPRLSSARWAKPRDAAHHAALLRRHRATRSVDALCALVEELAGGASAWPVRATAVHGFPDAVASARARPRRRRRRAGGRAEARRARGAGRGRGGRPRLRPRAAPVSRSPDARADAQGGRRVVASPARPRRYRRAS